GQLDLFEKTLRADDRRELGMKHLDRDAPVMSNVLGEIHGCHSTATELALDGVAAGERRVEFGSGVHGAKYGLTVRGSIEHGGHGDQTPRWSRGMVSHAAVSIVASSEKS